METELALPLQKLVDEFQRLPGIGRRTATRLAFSVLDFTEAQARGFADAIVNAKLLLKECKHCFNITEGDYCPICLDSQRDSSVICVVEDVKAVLSFEKIRGFNGVYHVLHGAISPIDGIGPAQLRISELAERVKIENVKEVIVATNATVEGEATASYITKILRPLGIKTTRLAYGIPVGGDLEYADEVTLSRAIEGRREM